MPTCIFVTVPVCASFCVCLLVLVRYIECCWVTLYFFNGFGFQLERFLPRMLLTWTWTTLDLFVTCWTSLVYTVFCLFVCLFGKISKLTINIQLLCYISCSFFSNYVKHPLSLLVCAFFFVLSQINKHLYYILVNVSIHDSLCPLNNGFPPANLIEKFWLICLRWCWFCFVFFCYLREICMVRVCVERLSFS